MSDRRLRLREGMRRPIVRFAIVLAIALAPPARSAWGVIDITGNWDVTITVGPPSSTQWQIIQSGNSFTIGSPPFYTGTIDPNTGALSFGGTLCDGNLTGPDGFVGSAAMDSNSFNAAGNLFLNTTPTTCSSFPATVSATRNPCGNGTLDPGEACDDGNVLGNDCCSFTCTVPADGKACDDGNPLTLTSVCVAGTCTVFSPPEFLVNNTTTGTQQDPRVACAADGGFVVVWVGDIELPTKSVLARRYDSAGSPLGTEFQIATSAEFPTPDVAASPAGDFVAVWIVETISGRQVFARRYDSGGTPLGTEFQINTTPGGATFPHVGTDAPGNFVVVWNADDDGSAGVFAQRFSSAGAPVGTEFQVNTYTTGDQSGSAISVNHDGSFVVGWVSSQPPDTASTNVFAQRFNSAGVPLGSEFQVSNDDLPNFHISGAPAITTNAGQVVFAWGRLSGPSFVTTILSRRYNLSGAPTSGEVTIDSGTLFATDVASDNSGRYVIAWTDSDENGTDISARHFASDGTPSGTEFQVNGFTLNNQYGPSVCTASAGDYVVTWESDQQDGSATGVFGRTFDVPPPPFTLDHYTCYQGSDLKNPQFAEVTVSTADQITNEMIDVQKLKYVCVPVDKNGEGVHDPAAYLSCYQVKGASLQPRPNVEVSTQFQTSRFEVKQPKLLCVPGTQTVLP